LLRPAFISEDATIGFAIDEMVSLRAGCMFTLGANGDVAGIFTVHAFPFTTSPRFSNNF